MISHEEQGELFNAVVQGRLDTVQLLFEKLGPAIVEAVSERGYTALYLASASGHLEIVQFLVRRCQANVEAASNDGGTPIYIASEHNHLAVVQRERPR
jgi:ankyrin repeat protein